jgi:hypothetical protein
MLASVPTKKAGYRLARLIAIKKTGFCLQHKQKPVSKISLLF